MKHRVYEGDIAKLITIENQCFEIRYGYSSEKDRGYIDPFPIYPDFTKYPVYTADGSPFALVYQDGCNQYEAEDQSHEEKWCANCVYFEKREEYIGICRCAKNRRKPQ